MPEFAGLIPTDLLDKEKKEEFLLWLVRLPVDIWTKKYILMDWCRIVGVKLDEDMVKYITGGRPELTRG
mgnify:CR=1 FL=1